jgi:hypothetical protein
MTETKGKPCRNLKTKYHKWTHEEVQFIKDNYPGHSFAEMTELFNRHFRCSLTLNQIRSMIFTKKIHTGSRNTYHKWTPEEVQFIKDNLSRYSYAKMTDLFNGHFGSSITHNQIKCIIRRNNFHNDHNWLKCKIGTERRSPTGYVIVKIDHSNGWRLKNRLIWEKANGPIPKGHCVIFADRNKLNFDLDNLLLVNYRELLVMSHQGLIFSDNDLTKAGKTIADINIQIAECERKLGTRRIRRKKTEYE